MHIYVTIGKRGTRKLEGYNRKESTRSKVKAVIETERQGAVCHI
jgi:hypothetical protein